jgi:hypothetical protein
MAEALLRDYDFRSLTGGNATPHERKFETMQKPENDPTPGPDPTGIITHGDQSYIPAGYRPLKEPVCPRFEVHTLTGMLEYINGMIDGKKINVPHVLHVADHSRVDLTTEIFGIWKQRDKPITATALKAASFDRQWMDAESFSMVLESGFVKTEALDELAGIVTEIKDSDFEGKREMSKSVILKPVRTFTEITQPDIRFVFKIRKDKGGPKFALFESGGSLWKIEAIRSIKAWFEEQMMDFIAIPVIG